MLSGVAGSNPAGLMDVCLVTAVCFQAEFSASGRSLVQRSSTECGVSEYDREVSIMRRSWHARGYCVMEKKVQYMGLRLGVA